MKEFFGLIAAGLVFVAYAPYLRDILSNKTKPHPYSWFIWGLTTVLIFALQLSHGAGTGAYTTATIAAMSFVVCILGFRQNTKDITLTDIMFLALALFAMVVWLVAKQPVVSITLLVGADVLGVGPSIRKAWHKPGEETLSTWSINALRHALAIVALQQYSFITLLNPVAWVLGDTLFSLMLINRRRVLKARKASH